MQGSVACVGSFNSCGQVCGGLNQGLPGTAQPAKAAGGVGDATITWPSALIPRADLSQLWERVRKQSVGEFVLRGIGFCASCVCFLLPRLGLVKPRCWILLRVCRYRCVMFLIDLYFVLFCALMLYVALK